MTPLAGPNFRFEPFFDRGKEPPRRACEFSRRVPEAASFPLLIGHKILCPNVHKIMPVAFDCQGFTGNFSMQDSANKTMSYKYFRNKCFKSLRKKMTLS